jgi:hypothetical protein
MMPASDARASQTDVSRARSFGVRVSRVHHEDAQGNYSGEVVFHTFPIFEDAARWLAGLIPRIDSQNRRYKVELETLDPDRGYKIVNVEDITR